MKNGVGGARPVGAAAWEMEEEEMDNCDPKGKRLLRGANVDDMIVSHQNPGSDNF